MSWVRVDDKAWCHPKFTDLPAGAVRLWLFAMCWCNQQETDGHVPRSALKLLGSSLRDASALLASGLWHETSTGWVIHDFLEYQASKTDRESKREALKQRVSKHRNAKVTDPVTRYIDDCNADGNSTRRNTTPTPRPNPNPTPRPTQTAREDDPPIGATVFGQTRDELLESPPLSGVRQSEPPPVASEPFDPSSHYTEIVMTIDWTPPPGTLAGTGLEPYEAEALDQFRAYHLGQARSLARWLPAYRTWVAKLKQSHAGRARHSGSRVNSGGNDVLSQQLERVERLRAEEAAELAQAVNE